MLQRVEPWIKRELQAILGDPDPSVIVHVASSLFLRSLEENNSPSRQLHDINVTTQLHPFLHNWTRTFWHELRYRIYKKVTAFDFSSHPHPPKIECNVALSR